MKLQPEGNGPTRLLISLHAPYLVNEGGTLSISTEIAFFLAQKCSTPQFTSVSSDNDGRRGGGFGFFTFTLKCITRYLPLSMSTTCFERALAPVPLECESPWSLEKTTPHPVTDQSVPDHE